LRAKHPDNGRPMMIIDKDTVTAIKDRIGDPKRTKQAIKDVRKMLEIKEALLWRADGMTPCCGSLADISAQLTHEVDILEKTLLALDNGDRKRAADLLQEYIDLLEPRRELSQTNCC
jgi:hypothetical protein